MPLETATYISDLVPSNPAHTDGLNQADSHMRLIKSVLQATFPNLTGAVTKTSADLTNGVVPIGTIVLWTGTLASIPAGWHVCDGTGGTLNLTDRFIVGAGSAYGQGTVGGSLATTSDGAHDHFGSSIALDGAHTHNTTATGTGAGTGGGTSDTAPAHSHTGSTGSHTLTLAEIPAHEHLGGVSVVTTTNTGLGGLTLQTTGAAFFQQGDSFQGGGAGHAHTIGADGSHAHNVSVSVTTAVTTAGTTDSQGTHNHSLAIVSAGVHSHTATPPYYALYYIQRTS